MDQRPLLKPAEAGRIAFPDLPERQAARRIYRWHAMRVLPPAAVVKVGRGVYLRAAVFRSWLEGSMNGGRPE